jgi:2,4-dienoyl-CoA reductase-like NADH-dependent reductase (Old Yellow Enzyme family)
MAAVAEPGPKLFAPLTLRGLALKNRVVISSMSMYSSVEGFSDDFHLVHLGRFALGGAGLVMMEATAVTPEGRITHGCNGVWRDDQVPALRRITDFLHRFDCAAGIQLGHSGPKGSTQRPWHGNGPLGAADAAARGESDWPVVAASPEPFDAGWIVPSALDESGMERLVEDYRQGARRVRDAGFDVVELHCAHGYLLHAFLSPLANKRKDAYGGSLENRMRFPLRVAEAVRAAWPEAKPMFVRISAVDGIGIGWSIEDSVIFAKALAARGIDAVDCSTGGMRLERAQVLESRKAGFQVPFAARIRREAGIATVAVGMIRDARQAEVIVAGGEADLVAIGREALVNPNWPALAALELEGDTAWRKWPAPFAWWLERRARALAKAKG